MWIISFFFALILVALLQVWLFSRFSFRRLSYRRQFMPSVVKDVYKRQRLRRSAATRQSLSRTTLRAAARP